LVFDKCPKCEAFTLIWEGDMNRYACLKFSCGYVSYKDGKKINRIEIEKEGEDCDEI
jgi:ssDNA-binding Zn-finger/Zn-ribbon topoisomerase 1